MTRYWQSDDPLEQALDAMDPLEKVLDAVSRGKFSARQIDQMIAEHRLKQMVDIDTDNLIFIMVCRTPPPERAKRVVQLLHPEHVKVTPEVQAYILGNLTLAMRHFLEGQ